MLKTNLFVASTAKETLKSLSFAEKELPFEDISFHITIN